MRKNSFRFLNKQINRTIKSAIAAASNDGREICGLLIYNGYFVQLVEVSNKIKCGGGFAFYAPEIRRIQKATNSLGNEIIGTFHSHPAYINVPSESDIANTLDDSYMLIIDVLDKKIGFWYIKDGKAKEVAYVAI